MKKKNRCVSFFRIGMILFAFLLLLTGCNEANPSDGDDETVTTLEDATKGETDATEEVTNADAVPQGIEVFYADLNNDGVEERIEVNYELANTDQELDAPTIVIYTEKDGAQVEIWSCSYTLAHRHKGVMLVGNKICFWNLVDDADSLLMGVAEVSFNENLQPSNMVPVVGKTLEKVNGTIERTAPGFYVTVYDFIEALDGGIILLSNQDGTLSYSTAERLLTEVAIPQWIRECFKDLFD